MTAKPTYEELEQQLKTCRQKTENYRQLIENLNEVVYMLDLEARVTYISPNIENLSGYRPEEIIGRKFTEFVHPDDLPNRMHYFQKIISGEGITTEYRYLTKNGEAVWVMTNGRPIFEGKEIVGIQGMLVDITERKETEKELFQTRQRFDFALQATKTGLWDWNIQTGEVVFNEQWAAMIGYSLDELRPLSIQTWMNLCHPDDLKKSNALIEKHFRNESEIYECEARMKHKDGSWIWIMDRGKILEWDESGNPLRMVGTHTEITERKQAEENLCYQKQLLETIINGTWDVLAIQYPDHTIERYNQAGYELLGLPPDKVDGRKCFELIGRDRQCLPCATQQALQCKEPVNIEKYVPELGKHLDCRSSPVIDENGDIVRIVEHLRDITRQKEIEKELRQSAHFLDNLMESIQDGLSILNPDLSIRQVNRTIRNWHKQQTPLEGKKCYQAYHNRESPCDPCPSLRCLQSGVMENEEIRVHTDVGTKWIEIFSYPLVNAENHTLEGVIEFVRDITERKKAEQEKDRLQAQLRQSQKMEAIGTLAGGIAHDFNNILSSVLGYTELSLEEVEKGTLLHQNLSQVLTAGNRAKDLVKQILVFGRKEEQEITPTPIIPLVKEALKMLRSTFPSSIEIRENISIEQGIVYADPTQLHQVIVNLATNAKQAMGDEGGILEVSVETVSFDKNIGKKYPDMAPGNYLQITVSDTGCGISEKYLDKIFEPYFTTSKTGTGSGLGLSVVHSIVKNHNGHITVYSEPGKETNFHVYIPLAEQERSRAASTVQEYEALPTGTENVFIVDDEKPIVEMQQQILEGLGYNVTSRTSSAEALEAFRTNPDKFDIVITDMTMPEMTGDRLALKIKEIRPDMPVILCTGFSEKIKEQKNGNPEVEGFMLKPVTKTDLANMVRKILDEGGND